MTLLLAVPVPDDPSVSYDMTMTRDGAGVVFAAGAIRPAGPAEVRVEIPPDAVLPGKYRVLLEERGTPEPMEFRFAFEVSGTEVE